MSGTRLAVKFGALVLAGGILSGCVSTGGHGYGYGGARPDGGPAGGLADILPADPRAARDVGEAVGGAFGAAAGQALQRSDSDLGRIIGGVIGYDTGRRIGGAYAEDAASRRGHCVGRVRVVNGVRYEEMDCRNTGTPSPRNRVGF